MHLLRFSARNEFFSVLLRNIKKYESESIYSLDNFTVSQFL
jgi:hypothetical protein